MTLDGRGWRGCELKRERKRRTDRIGRGGKKGKGVWRKKGEEEKKEKT